MRFIDEIEIVVASGKGGDGCVAFLRERYKPRGGPAGGDGGRGGALILEATRARNTLVDFRRNRVYSAQSGQAGGGRNRTGASGEDLLLPVPVGTQVVDLDTDELLADLDAPGSRWVLPGGQGGLGNARFASATNRTPQQSTPGEPGVTVRARLELKLLADVGLLGFPNAGKSTLISRVSAARPKVAAYPFTTLVPSLGVVSLEPGVSFVVADIPGLIEGASEGVGLGHTFLKHLERCGVYLHLLAPEDLDHGSVSERWRALRSELEAFEPDLVERPEIPVLTKLDIVDPQTREALLDELRAATGVEPSAISAVTGEGLPELLGRVASLLAAP